LQREKRRFQVIPNWPRKFPAILESIKYLAIAIDHIRRPGFRKRTALIAAATASITSAAAISAPPLSPPLLLSQPLSVGLPEPSVEDEENRSPRLQLLPPPELLLKSTPLPLSDVQPRRGRRLCRR